MTKLAALTVILVVLVGGSAQAAGTRIGSTCVPLDPRMLPALETARQAMSIHQRWATYLQAHPSYDKNIGSVAWHESWVVRYRQTIRILCRSVLVDPPNIP